MQPDQPAFPITVEALDEMEKLALACPTDFSHLPYRAFQQTLTIYSLLKLLEEHGIQLPLDLSAIGAMDGKADPADARKVRNRR